VPDYTEIRRTVDVPSGTGIDGVLKTIDTILQQSRVQEVVIRRGKVEYKRFVKKDEPEEELKIDLSTLMPWAIIRGTELQEIQPLNANAAVVISQLFSAAGKDGYNAIALACHPQSHLWEWHGKTTSVLLSKSEAYGLPIFMDADIPEEGLILCAAFSREARLLDTQKSYKVAIPVGRPK